MIGPKLVSAAAPNAVAQPQKREVDMAGRTNPTRKVVAQISMTLDGRVSGPGGPYDMEVVAGHATSVPHARANTPSLSGTNRACVVTNRGAVCPGVR